MEIALSTRTAPACIDKYDGYVLGVTAQSLVDTVRGRGFCERHSAAILLDHQLDAAARAFVDESRNVKIQPSSREVWLSSRDEQANFLPLNLMY